MSSKSSDFAIVIVSILALIISSVSTYINFFYNKNELTVAITNVSVARDSTLHIDIAWINSGNKNIAINSAKLLLSNAEMTSTHNTKHFIGLLPFILKIGDIENKKLIIKDIFTSLQNEEKKYLILTASILTSGGTQSNERLVLGKIDFHDSIFELTGNIGKIKTDFKRGLNSHESAEKLVFKFEF